MESRSMDDEEKKMVGDSESILTADLRTFLSNVMEIWRDIGFLKNEKQVRLDNLVEDSKKFWDECLKGENKLRLKHLHTAEVLGEEFLKLCRELEVEATEPSEDLTIIELEQEMRLRLENLKVERDRRIAIISKYTSEDSILSQELGSVPYLVKPNRVPTEKQLTEIQIHIADLKNEKVNRLKKVVEAREVIANLFMDLEKTPVMDFEKDLLNYNCDVPITGKHMSKLVKLQEKLEAQLKHNEMESISLKNRLKVLWARLDMDKTYQESFLLLHSGCKPSTLKSLTDEVNRCEELKMQNLKRFIDLTRMELANLWDKCYYSKEQRAKFTPLDEKTLTEELLEAHEREIERLKEFTEGAKDILAKISLRENLWVKMLELEHKANVNDPKRYNNRGGNLLQEEKERKNLMIRLPKIEKELQDMVDQWEEEHNDEFLMYGVGIGCYIADQWTRYNQGKENERKERQMLKQKQLEQEMLSGSRQGTPTPRKRLLTPTTPSKNKKSRNAPLSTLTPGNILSTCNVFPSPYGLPPKALSKGTLRSVQERRLKKQQQRSVLMNSTQDTIVQQSPFQMSTINASVSSYTDFSKPLLQHADIDNLNSTTTTNAHL